MNNRFDDEFSTTNVSLIDDDNSSRRITASPVPVNNSTKENGKKEKFKSGLKHQETTVDGLKKENFDLRMSLYYYEERISQMSTENIDNITKENKNLKAEIQKYMKDLKTYKKMILELNQAVEILQKKPCPLAHGMSAEEKEEMENMKKQVENFHDENDKLSRMMADLSAENVRLRSNLRSKTSSTGTDYSSSSECNNEDHHDIYRKYRQTKIKLEEQQRMLQQTNSSRLYDRDKVALLNRQLEDDLKMERKRGDKLQVELEKYTRNLNETKQQLRNKNIECNQLIEENDDLRTNNENMGTLIDNIRHLEEENTDLVNEIQDREQEIEALEAELFKLLSHVERHPEQNSRETDERLLSLESTLQEREDEIDILKNELKSINESHDHDIEAFEQHVNKTQVELEEKDKENKELLMELEQIKREYEETLEKKENELAVSYHDKQVSMATMEGDLLALQDTMQREKEFLQEEIEELKGKIRIIYEQLQEKEAHIADLTNMLNSRNGSEQSYGSKSDSSSQKMQEKLIMLENKVKEYQEKIKRDQRKAEEQLEQQNNAYRALKQKLFTANQKYNILNGQVDTKNASASKNDRQAEYNRLYKLNEELRRELDDKDVSLEKERKKIDEYKQLYQRQGEIISNLEKELDRRVNQLARSLLDRDRLKEEGELMGHILLEQATGAEKFKSQIIKQ